MASWQSAPSLRASGEVWQVWSVYFTTSVSWNLVPVVAQCWRIPHIVLTGFLALSLICRIVRILPRQ